MDILLYALLKKKLGGGSGGNSGNIPITQNKPKNTTLAVVKNDGEIVPTSDVMYAGKEINPDDVMLFSNVVRGNQKNRVFITTDENTYNIVASSDLTVDVVNNKVIEQLQKNIPGKTYRSRILFMLSNAGSPASTTMNTTIDLYLEHKNPLTTTSWADAQQLFQFIIDNYNSLITHYEIRGSHTGSNFTRDIFAGEIMGSPDVNGLRLITSYSPSNWTGNIIMETNINAQFTFNAPHYYSYTVKYSQFNY